MRSCAPPSRPPPQEARRPPPLVARLAPAADAGRAKGVPPGVMVISSLAIPSSNVEQARSHAAVLCIRSTSAVVRSRRSGQGPDSRERAPRTDIVRQPLLKVHVPPAMVLIGLRVRLAAAPVHAILGSGRHRVRFGSLSSRETDRSAQVPSFQQLRHRHAEGARQALEDRDRWIVLPHRLRLAGTIRRLQLCDIALGHISVATNIIPLGILPNARTAPFRMCKSRDFRYLPGTRPGDSEARPRASRW